MYNITPHSNEVSVHYDLSYQINASFICAGDTMYIACQKPKRIYYKRFVEFACDASELIVCLCNDKQDYFKDEENVKIAGKYKNINRYISDKNLKELKENKHINKNKYMKQKTTNEYNTNINKNTCEVQETRNYENHTEIYNKDKIFNEVYEIQMIKNVKRIKFKKWDDFNVPELSHFNVFYNAYRQIEESKKPIIVHCKAGVGRTGTFILYDILKRKNKVDEHVFIDELINLRKQRNFMVYNNLQLEWLVNVFLGDSFK